MLEELSRKPRKKITIETKSRPFVKKKINVNKLKEKKTETLNV